MSKDTVRILVNRIRDTFSNLPYPDNIGVDLEFLEGKAGSELFEPDFARIGADLTRFSNTGFRYYLPHILIFVLTNPDSELSINDEIFGSVGGLAPPSNLQLNFLGRVAEFSLIEREMIFDFLIQYRKLVDTGYYYVSETIYGELSTSLVFWKKTLNLPPSLSINERKELSDKIVEAFTSIPKPTILGDFDSSELVVEIATVDREDLEIHDLHWLDNLLEKFTPEAFHYYIPTFISGMILNPKNSGLLPSKILNTLTASDDFQSDEFYNRIKQFNHTQSVVISTFFAYFKNLEPFGLWLVNESERLLLEKAFSYWNE